METKQPNAEQIAAVLEFKDAYEKSYPDWKGHLRDAWYQGWDDKAIGDGYNGNGYLLRQVRNRFGTAWLNTFEVEVTVKRELSFSAHGLTVSMNADDIIINDPGAFAPLVEDLNSNTATTWWFAIEEGMTSGRDEVIFSAAQYKWLKKIEPLVEAWIDAAWAMREKEEGATT